jgi:hypothetical protein
MSASRKGKQTMNAQRAAVHHPAIPEARESLPDLLGDLMKQSGELVKDELALARAEFRQEARFYSSASVIVAIGAAFGLLAAMALIAAGIIALARYTGLVTSSLIFGGTLTLIAALVISRGVHHFRHHSS